MNNPSNKNQPYHPVKFNPTVSYEGIGTSDCTTFAFHTNRGKMAYEAEKKFRSDHPEICNVTANNDLYSWFNNSSCTVDACVPLLKHFAEIHNCPMHELVNLVQKCIVQSTLESAYRLYNVVETHRMFSEGLYEQSNSSISDPMLPPPIWKPAETFVAPNPVDVKPLKNDTIAKIKPKKANTVVDTLLSYTSDELFLDTVTKIDSFGKLSIHCIQKLCKKIGIKKYSTMNKEGMIQKLYAYKERYNLYPSFRFQHFYIQETCNALDCSASVNINEVYGVQWKYCSTHSKDQGVLSAWDKTVNSTFWDIDEKRRLCLDECIQKFQSKTFTDILRERNAVKTKVPFLLDTSGLNQTLCREKSAKQKGSIRSALSKNKSVLSGLKRTRHVRIDNVVPSSPICSDGDQKEIDDNDVFEDIEEIETEVDNEDDTIVDIEEEDQDQENDENEFSEEEEPDDDLDDSLVSPKRTFDDTDMDARKRVK